MQDIGDGSGRVESEKQSEVGRRLPVFWSMVKERDGTRR